MEALTFCMLSAPLWCIAGQFEELCPATPGANASSVAGFVYTTLAQTTISTTAGAHRAGDGCNAQDASFDVIFQVNPS